MALMARTQQLSVTRPTRRVTAQAMTPRPENFAASVLVGLALVVAPQQMAPAHAITYMEELRQVVQAEVDVAEVKLQVAPPLAATMEQAFWDDQQAKSQATDEGASDSNQLLAALGVSTVALVAVAVGGSVDTTELGNGAGVRDGAASDLDSTGRGRRFSTPEREPSPAPM